MEGKKKCIVVALNKTGCIDYAYWQINALHHYAEIFVIESANSYKISNHNSLLVPTYGNTLQFLTNTLFIIKKLLRFIRQLIADGYSTIFFPYPHPWHTLITLYLDLKKVTILTTVHEYIPHKGEKNTIYLALERRLYKKSTHLFFLSQYVLDTVSDKKINKKAILIHHGLIPSPNKNIKQWKEGPKKLLFMGRITGYKGVDILIEALEDIWDQVDKLTIAGKGNLIFPKSLNKIKRLDYFLTPNEMDELLAEHDMIILPYTAASQSGILSMAIAAGVPAIITNVGGLSEQISDHCAVFCDPTPISLKNSIIKLSKDETLFNKIVEELRESKYESSWIDAAGLIAEKIK